MGSTGLTTHDGARAEQACADRPIWPAVKRGLRGRCPACGEGGLLHHYLEVADACPRCDEEMHHHRADDFPAYVTILVVGHVLVGLMFAVDETWPNLPLAVHFAVWPALVVVMSLWLLPIVKGGLVAYQWALRMHGFETAHQPPSGAFAGEGLSGEGLDEGTSRAAESTEGAVRIRKSGGLTARDCRDRPRRRPGNAYADPYALSATRTASSSRRPPQ